MITLPDLSRSQLVLRTLVVLGPVVGVLATGPAGHWPPWWLLVVALAAGGAWAARPESAVGVASLVLVLLWWTLDAPDPLGAGVLVAGVATVVAHVAALLASYGPGGAPLDPALVRLWARRGAAVTLTVPVVWGLAVALRGEPDRAGVWAVGVTAALVATVAATIALTSTTEVER